MLCRSKNFAKANENSHSWFKYGFLLSAMQCPFFLLNSMSAEPILLLALVVALRSSLPCTARYRLPGNCMKFSLSSRLPYTFPTQGTHWELNVRAGGIVLHLKSVILHRLKVGSEHLIINVWQPSPSTKLFQIRIHNHAHKHQTVWSIFMVLFFNSNLGLGIAVTELSSILAF